MVALPAAVTVAAASLVLELNGGFYADRPAALMVLAIAAVPCVANDVLSSAALSEGRVRAWLLSDVALAATLAGLAVALVPAHGATGLAWAYLAAYTVSAAVLLPVLSRSRPVVVAEAAA